MSVVVNAVLPLGVPVLSVDEQLFFLAPTVHRVRNRARKLLFFFEAQCRHRVAELGEVSTASLEAGDILVLPHACEHEYVPTSAQTTRVHALRLVLDPELIAPLVPGMAPPAIEPAPLGQEPVSAFVATHFHRMMHLKGGMTPEVRETLARIRREAEGNAGQPELGCRYRVGAACLELMVLVARQVQAAAPTSALRRPPAGTFRVEAVREFVVRHLDTPLGLELIAEQMGITPEHLARVWKKATGTTIFDYVRRSRIERAKSLLISSDANISEISRACGFSSPALFSRTFKQEAGYSPNRYRDRLAR